MEAIAELLLLFFEFLFYHSEAKDRRYHKIERIIANWAEKVGVPLQYDYKDDKKLILTVRDDAGNSYTVTIHIKTLGRLKIGVQTAAQRKQKSWNKQCRTSNLTKVLFEAYGVIEQWILKSGNTRTKR